MPPTCVVRESCARIASICRIGLKQSLRTICNDCPPPEPPPCDICKTGCKQSPIDITTSNAKKIELPPLKIVNHFGDDTNLCMYFMDNSINIVPNSVLMSIEGGPLAGMFVLDKCHFHWGTDENDGSEHSIDKQKYTMEAHLKYFNIQYGSFDKALSKPDGVAVVSVLIKADPASTNCDFENAVKLVPSVRPGKTIPLPQNVLKMFKETLESQTYYTYEGSITKPPCSEEVTWIVCKNVIGIDCEQVEPFRKICNEKNEIVTSNCRDTQSLNGRRVYTVMPPKKESAPPPVNPEKPAKSDQPDRPEKPKAEPPTNQSNKNQ